MCSADGEGTTGGTSRFAPARLIKLLQLLLLVVFAVVLLRNAWVCDDAYITFRTIDNFLNGQALSWNTAERVQAYTHPAWMFLMMFLNAITGEFFLTVIFLSFVLTLAGAVWLVYRGAARSAAGILGLLLLMLSKAFVDYSMSGLENPLTHLLIVLFLYVYFARKSDRHTLFLLSFTAGLAVCNRMDTILLFAPAIAYAFWKVRSWRAPVVIIAGFAPVLLWELFALFYYGLPFPNTYYAKLHTGIAKADLVRQGLYYLWDSLRADPLTLLVLAAGCILPVALKELRKLPVVIGTLVYTGYVVYIGGDFMSGRFLAAPFLCAVVIIAHSDLSRLGKKRFVLYAAALLVGLASRHSPIYSTADYGGELDYETIINRQSGIADERAHYFFSSSLLNWRSGVEMPNHHWAEQGQNIQAQGTVLVTKSAIGYFGFFAGPKVHIIDDMGLADPLLARLPVSDPKKWRIGHFRRQLPYGYIQSLRYGSNLIKDSGLAQYYQHIKFISRGELFSPGRITEIVKLNLGYYDSLLNAYRHEPLTEYSLKQVTAMQVSIDTASRVTGYLVIPSRGIEIDLEATCLNQRMEIGLDNDDDYIVVFIKAGTELSDFIAPAQTDGPSGMSVQLVNIPGWVRANGFDRLRVYPYRGDGVYRLGYLKLLE
ncbi:MAG: glycosyltransferase family 39 protein [candidate division Zixibacteria bacterium]|nr:glycosyltransferase family 39 protein [candidate division Zixibacteria bacterium]